ncbi:hypothetical protein SCLCIDRAFT_26272 [Scleroderma citrinum Foug A]|uniref:Uncharacterized protein n=1 Tax=Scleroderma citrinum Foug A TaxID=1036808 RepID=A0A0C2ZH10_9AGAM|nr:hypothetical protein SCLCIDRAFT_26272 [Scleroderma citrinum Foug A]
MLSNSANIQSVDMCLGLNPVPLEAPADVTASLSVPDTEVPTLGKVQTKPPPSLKPGLAPTSALDQLDLELIEFLSVASAPASPTSRAVASLEPMESLLQGKASTDSSKHIALSHDGSNGLTPQCDNLTLPQESHFDDNNLNLDEVAEGNNFTVGRPSEATLDTIQEGLDYIGTYLADLAARTGQPPQQIIDHFLKQYAWLIPANDWNQYAKYFAHYMEHLRKTGEFTGTIDGTPSVTIRKKCYELFKKQYPENGK